MLWYEKYAPNISNALTLHKPTLLNNLIEILRNMISKNGPKILVIIGNSGSGKTSLLRCAAHSVNAEITNFDSDQADDLDIFLKTIPLSTNHFAHRILVIDGDISDNLQQSMESYGNGRTILNPLVWTTSGRCIPDNFKTSYTIFRIPIPYPSTVKQILLNICGNESIECTNNISAIVKSFSGDIRQAINALQFNIPPCPVIAQLDALYLQVLNQKSTFNQLMQIFRSLQFIPSSAFALILFENFPIRYTHICNINHELDILSIADTLSDLQCTSDILAMSVSVSNEHPNPQRFLPMANRKINHFNTPKDDSPFLCWPASDLSSDEMESILFDDEKQARSIMAKWSHEEPDFHTGVDPNELAEALRILRIDPIEDADDTFFT